MWAEFGGGIIDGCRHTERRINDAHVAERNKPPPF
jgi:hypothetical protein